MGSVNVRGGRFYEKFLRPSMPERSVGMGGGGGGYGAEMDLRFVPGQDVQGWATEIHLVQTVRDIIGDQQVYDQLHQGNAGFNARKVPDGHHAGWGIDMEPYGKGDGQFTKILAARNGLLPAIAQNAPDNTIATLITYQDALDAVMRGRFRSFKRGNNGEIVTSLDPRYAQQRLSPHVPPYAAAANEQTTGWACARPDTLSAWTPKEACLRDAPQVGAYQGVAGMEFEVAALAETDGRSEFVGSVVWSWSFEPRGVTVAGPTLKSHESASNAFFSAADYFNQLPLPEPYDNTQNIAQGVVFQAMTLPLNHDPNATDELEFEDDFHGGRRAGSWRRAGNKIIVYGV